MLNTWQLLNKFSKLGFSLIKLKVNQKLPVDNKWTESDHKDIQEWFQWLEDGYNFGVLTGEKSGITVIDLDQPEAPPELRKLLNLYPTLTQKTNKGTHFFYKHEPSLPSTRLDDLKVDILNKGRQCVISPSIVDGYQRLFINDIDIMPMPKEMALFLRERSSKPRTELEAPLPLTEVKKLPEGLRNNTLVKLGGMLRKEFNVKQTFHVLSLINRNFMKVPISDKEVWNMTRSLSRYIDLDMRQLSQKILEYLKIVQEANIYDIKDYTKEDRDVVVRALNMLEDEGFILKHRKNYHIIMKADWKEDLNYMGEDVSFIVPYFDALAYFCWSDVVLIGSSTGSGKTHLAMNIIRQLVNQKIKPYYITSEAGSRFGKIASRLGLQGGDFFWDYIPEATSIELEPRSITILDWLMVEDKCMTDQVFKYFQKQLYKSKGFLFIFQQLKEFNHEWFAPNMAKQFPVVCARYLIDRDDRSKSKFIIDKVRESKTMYFKKDLDCAYNWATKVITLVGNHASQSV